MIEVSIPKQMVLEVVETAPGEKGNTAQGASKVGKQYIISMDVLRGNISRTPGTQLQQAVFLFDRATASS